MLTRLKVSGFKNLVDVDVRFGAFTCIAGVNGVGKSNLFDAIRFLSALADHTLVEAALLVRDESAKTGDVRNLFHRVDEHYADKMSFEAEMIIPEEGINFFGKKVKATSTFLKYSLELAYRKNNNSLRSLEKLEILKEELSAINEANIDQHLLLGGQTDTWRKSAIKSEQQTISEFISTEVKKDTTYLKLYRDKEQSLEFEAKDLNETVLSKTAYID